MLSETLRSVELNPFGPDHTRLTPAPALLERTISAPAQTSTGPVIEMTEGVWPNCTRTESLLEQLPLLTVTEYVPLVLTLMDESVEPVFQKKVKPEFPKPELSCTGVPSQTETLAPRSKTGESKTARTKVSPRPSQPFKD